MSASNTSVLFFVRADPAVQITNIPLKETNVFVLSFSPLDPITTVTPAQIFKLAMCAKQKIDQCK